MSVLENFKNIPRSPSHRATGPECNFFLSKFATKSLEKKRGGAVAPQRATGGACRPPCGRQGGLSPPPAGDRGKPLYIRSNPPLPSSFEPENSTKNPKKREE